jgi:hypothetical protein
MRPVRRARNAEPAVLVASALVAGGGRVGNQQRAGMLASAFFSVARTIRGGISDRRKCCVEVENARS